MARKEYLKMADFFYGELYANDDDGIGSIIDADGEYVMQAMENTHMASCSNKGRNEHRKLIAVAAAHAINSHDELVAEVERLRGALSASMSVLYEVERVTSELIKNGCYVVDDINAEVSYSIKLVEAIEE